MSSSAIYFLACLLSVTIVSPRSLPKIPEVVAHPDHQCQLKGHAGMCTFPYADDVFNCEHLECAMRDPDVFDSYRLVFNGPAAHGIHCGQNKICYDGDCIDLPDGIDMPHQIHRSNEHFVCDYVYDEYHSVE